MAHKGVRFIKGREYLLSGRYCSKAEARSAAVHTRKRWESVRIIKLWDCDYMIYVHAARSI